MTSRTPFSLDEFVRARLAFDHGNGLVEAWAQITEISLWRLDELAEQSGSRTWSMLVAPIDAGTEHDGVQQRLRHAVHSGGLGHLSLPAFWRVSAESVHVSRVLVVFEIEAQRAVRLARRYGQIAVVHVQRIPFEQLVVLNVTNEQSVEMRRYEPQAIAQALARIVGAAAVAVAYGATSVGESQLMGNAEGRLRG